MSKYIDAEKLKIEIERLREINRKALENGHITDDVFHGRAQTLNYLFEFIDSLQQEHQEVDLNENTMKKEFRMIDSACLLFNYDKLSREQLIARRFYQLGLKAGKEG